MATRNQLEILEEMQRHNFNVCSCGNCGGVILVDKKMKQSMEISKSGEDLTCPHCKLEMAYSVCPDLYDEGMLELDN